MSKLTETLAGVETDTATAATLAIMADSTIAAVLVDDNAGRAFAISRNDFKVDQVTPANRAEVFMPKLIVAKPKLQNATSLIEYINGFKNEHSMTFADITTDTIVSVMDYHLRPAMSEDGHQSNARLGENVATLALPKSEEWSIWTGVNEKLISHIDFASFLEENAFDVVSPAGADLLELCRDLQVKQDMSFSSSIRMGDAVSVSYSKEEDATTKQNMTLPVKFMISIPVYFGEPPVTIECYMRRKISGGTLYLGYKMIRLEATRQREFNRVVGEVEAATAVTTVFGVR